MPKAELTTFVTPKCQQLADSMGLELVDVCLDKEGAGKYLRIYLDKPEGLTMDDCEKFHRAIQPQLEKYDYDFLEVSSPGIDRPLKTPRDYERHLGDEVEVKLFKAVDGVKLFTGILAGLDEENNISTFVIDQKGPCTVDSVEDSFCTFETNGTTPERSDARILYLSQKYGTHRNMEPEEEEKE